MKLKIKAQKRIVLLSCALLFLALVAVGRTMAYLQSSTPLKTNNFVAPIADVQIKENSSSFQFDSNLTTVKKVRIQNVSHVENNVDKAVPVYIRVKLIPIWRHAGTGEGTGIPVDTAGLKYWYDKNGTRDTPIPPWFYNQGDGYYYFKTRVEPGEFTDYLIGKVSVTQVEPDCDLEVQVIADSIQADGKTESGDSAAKAVWGVDPQTLTN